MPGPEDLNRKTVAELRALARARRLRGYSKLRKRELVRLLTVSTSTGTTDSRRAHGASKATVRSQARNGPRHETPIPDACRETPGEDPESNIRVEAPVKPAPRADETKFARAALDHGAGNTTTDTDDAGMPASRPVPSVPRLVILPQKPGVVHVYWRLSPEPSDDLRLRVLRIGHTGHEILADFRPLTAEGNAYIQVPETREAVECRAELGRRAGDGRFDLVVSPAAARVPGNQFSPHGDPRWWISAEDFITRHAQAVHPARSGMTSWPGVDLPSSDDPQRRR